MKLLTNKILCASLNYRRLNKTILNKLDSASINNDYKSLENFKSSLGFEVESIAIIKKCNAIILVLSYKEDLSFEFITGRILTTWDYYANVSITTLINDIKFHTDLEAIEYLAECAAGIHSVTIGDSQVLSQLKQGLASGLQGETGVLKLISIWLEDIVNESKLKTSLFDGNTSLERIACKIIVDKIKKDKCTVLFGYGKSGKLIAKILNRENSLPLQIVNRSKVEIKKDKLNTKNVQHFSWRNYLPKENPNCIIIAIDNTKETSQSISKILKKMKGINQILFVDLSTPSLLEGKVKNYVGLEEISKIANENIEKRKKEINKVKKIISNYLPIIIEQINTLSAEIYLSEQKHTQINKLEKEKLELVFKRSDMYKIIREYLDKKNFVEVTTPYIVGISTDPPKVDKGGTIDVEWANNSTAFLRQSNQIYKQILVASGMKKIYEIGPFWRKEERESYRHLQESIGLDIEIRNPKNTEALYHLACNIIKKYINH
jgi:glutamyl-tRNA reductase